MGPSLSSGSHRGLRSHHGRAAASLALLCSCSYLPQRRYEQAAPWLRAAGDAGDGADDVLGSRGICCYPASAMRDMRLHCTARQRGLGDATVCWGRKHHGSGGDGLTRTHKNA